MKRKLPETSVCTDCAIAEVRLQVEESNIFDVSCTTAPSAGFLFASTTFPVTVPEPLNCIVAKPVVPSCAMVAELSAKSVNVPRDSIAAALTVPMGKPVNVTRPLAPVV